MFDPAVIVCALLCGIIARSVGMPALLGYLAAGFVLHEFKVVPGEFIGVVAELGVTLLLFSIGLKLELKDLLVTRIWGTAVVHMGLLQLLFSALLYVAAQLIPSLGLDINAVLILAFALTFSSTVFVMQIMQERGEMASRHANIAIGILIIQDIAAVVFLGFSAGKVPELGALWLLLLIPLRGVVLRFLSLAGHGELFTLFGLALAVLGAEVFESVGIKGDLGALVLGFWLAGDQKAKELSKNLLYFKDLFLVGFFLSIGLGGWPGTSVLLLALVIGVMALLKPPLYFLLLTRFNTGQRSAFLASLSLTNFSEFGLIVVAVSVQAGWLNSEWSAALSLVVAVSFLISSPLNMKSHLLYDRWHDFLARFRSREISGPNCDLMGASICVLGMGTIGTGAYSAMRDQYGDCVIGVDDNDKKLATHRLLGRKVLAADASDPDFWSGVDLGQLKMVMLALTNHEENKLVSQLLRDKGFEGSIAAVVRFQEEADELQELGISSFNQFAEAGRGFAAHAAEQISLRPEE
jgi:glutathione-regulated potassium-efflux system ancillary protein KefC